MKLLCILVALLAFGCDSAGLRTNIDTFTCGLIPWYAADCESSEIHDKAIGILDHGAVEAHIECTSNYTSMLSVSPFYNTLTIDKFIDGSAMYSWGSTHTNGIDLFSPVIAAPVRFCDRTAECASEWALPTYEYYAHNSDAHTITYRIEAGEYTVTHEWTGGPYGAAPYPVYNSPLVYVDELVSEVCTGFNLEAFD